jgi:hypothetical protein
MSTFSEESRLLIGNWEAVTDILQAHRRLQSELVGIIRALEPQLVATDWWGNGWTMTYQEQGATLANSRWRHEGTDPVVVWLYWFTPDAVFGEAQPPVLCVWIAGKRAALVRDLIAGIKERDGEGGVVGELDERPNNNYIVRQVVPRCLPEQLDEYMGEVGEQILIFFTHYGRLLDELTPVIGRHLNGDRDS